MRFRNGVREFIIDKLVPLVEGCDENNEDIPKEAFEAMGKSGMIAARIGPQRLPSLSSWVFNFPVEFQRMSWITS